EKTPRQKTPREKTPRQKKTMSPSHLERASEWSGVRAGDPVEIAGLSARSTSWSFLAYVRNVRTGEEWVEVVGGRAGRRAVRCFRPELVFDPSPRSARRAVRAKRASLASSPRLPF
ncbi:MAG: hypothetical protein M0010_06365, partial [Actinomycetota bacterium]|nr:hypothetical protein [Actinomycetota bacterium]